MSIAYTKTFAIIGLGQMLVRIPLTYVVDPVPFASHGVFWGGFLALVFFPVIGAAFDFGSWALWKIRVSRRSR